MTTDTAALRDELAAKFNDAVVKITEAAILHLDADEDNAAQLQAFEQALLPVLAALSAEPADGLREARVKALEALNIPHDIQEQVLAMGRAEWGATEAQSADEHLADFAKTLRITREHFNLEDVPVQMHGLYLEANETVLCHTGTSPNSPANAQALTGAWNWLFDQCAAIRALQSEGKQ
jgi:hypothetical protein